MQNKLPLSTILKWGLCRRCPVCGTSGMFQGYLKISDRCATCHLDFDQIRSDDAPAYFTIAIVGHVLLPIISYVEYRYSPSLMTHLIAWPPLITGMTLGLLPYLKGLMMAVMWLAKVKPTA
jgi:uncharacterized protein (DUF983 family)